MLPMTLSRPQQRILLIQVSTVLFSIIFHESLAYSYDKAEVEIDYWNTTTTSTIERQVTRSAMITFSGKDIHVYVNGVEKKLCHDETSFETVNVDIADGDTVSFNAEDTSDGFGVIFAIEYDDKIIASGTESDFYKVRAIEAFGEFNMNLPWMRKTYPDICSWLPIQPFTELNRNKTLAKGFPFDRTKAKFVWTAYGKDTNFIYIRHTIGGEKCPGVPGRLFYTGTEVQVYVNGLEKARTSDPLSFKTLYVFLRNGDAIGLWAKDSSRYFGVKAALVMDDGREWLTGVDGSWRASKQNTAIGPNQDWQMNMFDICTWDEAIISRNIGSGWGKNFPNNGARYIWASNANGQNDISIRTTVGFQSCMGTSKIYISGKDVHLYQNGVQIEYIHDAADTKRIEVEIRSGDVLAIWSEDTTSKHGLFSAVVLPDGRSFATGKSGGWRATKAFATMEDNEWKVSGGVDQCEWPLPKIVNDYDAKTVKGYPVSTNARHVWAQNAASNDEIFMRLDVGVHCATLYLTGADVDFYINGKFQITHKNQKSFTSKSLSVKTGDVLAFWVEDKTVGNDFGFALALVYDDEEKTIFATGQETFRSIQRISERGADQPWMLSGFEGICDWPDAIIVDRPGDRGIGFPFGITGGRFVWAAGYGKDKDLHVRMRIGGETLCTNQPLSMHIIIFNSNSPTTMYVNGMRYPSQQSIGHQKVEVRLKKNDVIALVAKGVSSSNFGVIGTVIELDNKGFTRSISGTGDKKWKATAYTSATLLRPSTNACEWVPAVLRSKSYPSVPFPACPTNSKFVWASGVAGNQDIILRYRVGSDC